MRNTAIDFGPPLFTAPSDGDAAAGDSAALFGAAILRVERRLRILERLTQIGMDITEAFAKLSRTVGLTLNLDMKADERVSTAIDREALNERGLRPYGSAQGTP